MSQDKTYRDAVDAFGASLIRLSAAYEADPEARRDLLQDIHLQLWRSFEYFDGGCSLRTWVYRVAHNTGASHVLRQRRTRRGMVGLEALDSRPAFTEAEASWEQTAALDRIHSLIRRLKPIDRQVIVLYLEGEDAASTAEITGLSPANVAMKIHRLKQILKKWFHEGVSDAK